MDVNEINRVMMLFAKQEDLQCEKVMHFTTNFLQAIMCICGNKNVTTLTTEEIFKIYKIVNKDCMQDEAEYNNIINSQVFYNK